MVCIHHRYRTGTFIKRVHHASRDSNIVRQRLECDEVRVPVPFLNALGITLDPKTQRPRTDPKTLESARDGIYLAGVIVAGMHTNEIFIENGRFHGKQIAAAIAAELA